MKHLPLAFFLFVTLFWVGSLSSQTKSTEPSVQPTGKSGSEKLHVTVDSISLKDARSILTIWTCDRTWKKLAKSEEKTLAENGDLLRWVQYTGTEQPLTDQFSYLYAGKQKLKEYRWTGRHMTHRVFIYDALGRMLIERLYEGKDLSETVKYYYPSASAKQPMKQVVFYAGEKEPGMTTVYTYNATGQLLKEEQFDSAGLYESDQCQYDQTGRLKSKSMYVSGQDAGAHFFYLYEGDLLVRDSVKTVDGTTEYHLYERRKL